MPLDWKDLITYTIYTVEQGVVTPRFTNVKDFEIMDKVRLLINKPKVLIKASDNETITTIHRMFDGCICRGACECDELGITEPEMK